jgi:hypothetical protein
MRLVAMPLASEMGAQNVTRLTAIQNPRILDLPMGLNPSSSLAVARVNAPVDVQGQLMGSAEWCKP